MLIYTRFNTEITQEVVEKKKQHQAFFLKYEYALKAYKQGNFDAVLLALSELLPILRSGTVKH